MIIQSLKTSVLNNLTNIPGWNTKRHLVVIESDDWGSIRMPSTSVFDDLIMRKVDLLSDDSFRYNKFDSLATSEDLSSLFDVLWSVKDCTGSPAVIVPVSNVANPDFKKIRHSDFNEYYYEPFTETLKKYSGCENSFALWKEGISNRIFIPQFHGREHLNVKIWMRALKGMNDNAIKAFNNEMWGISTANDPEIRVEFQAAFDFIDPADIMNHEQIIVSGLDLFEELFGYRASYFVPPNGPFSSKLESVCQINGIQYLSTPKIHNEPLGFGKTQKQFHWLGKKNKYGLMYLTRNCFFEPSVPNKDWVNSCLNNISMAFKWHKPAVISSHRVNYIGALVQANRDNGLRQLKTLLKEIVKRWPKVEFITTDKLGAIINNDKIIL